MTTNIEARALAVVLKATSNYPALAAEARAGGRQLTKQIAEKYLRYGPEAFVDAMTNDPGRTWHFQLDPSGSYQHGDPRREPEARQS